MQHVGKSKIGNLSAKGFKYPQLRLPKRYLDTVGKTANIYETEHEGKQAFLIVTEHSVPKEGMVLKPGEQVLKTMSRCSTVSTGYPSQKCARFHGTVSDGLTLEKLRRKLYY